ncbi:MAG: NAD(P)H-hydrate epimerase [Myxococcota bacterium]
MRYASTAEQVRALDAAVIEGLGLPGVALMELAAHGVAERIRAHHAEEAARGVVVACGPGNNGGDGWAVARWLRAWGFPAAVWPLGAPKPGTDAHVMQEVARKAGVPERSEAGDAGLLVDAVFGTGLARDVGGRFADAVAAMNAHPAPVVAVDLPSGLHSDTGAVLGCCVQAVRTVTFARHKVGMLLGEGPAHCGAVDVVDIGLAGGHARRRARRRGAPRRGRPAAVVAGARRERPRATTALTDRGGLGRDGRRGRAVLLGALAGGVGRCTLLAPRGARSRLAALPPEVMVLDGGEGDVPAALPDTGRFDALAAGPGLGGATPCPSAWPRICAAAGRATRALGVRRRRADVHGAAWRGRRPARPHPAPGRGRAPARLVEPRGPGRQAGRGAAPRRAAWCCSRACTRWCRGGAAEPEPERILGPVDGRRRRRAHGPRRRAARARAAGPRRRPGGRLRARARRRAPDRAAPSTAGPPSTSPPRCPGRPAALRFLTAPPCGAPGTPCACTCPPPPTPARSAPPSRSTPRRAPCSRSRATSAPARPRWCRGWAPASASRAA